MLPSTLSRLPPYHPAGTPAKPAITAVSGSPTAGAPHTSNITFPKVYTASSYAIELSDVFRTSAPPVTDSLTNVEHSEAGPWTRTLTVPAKGTYRFKVRQRVDWCDTATWDTAGSAGSAACQQGRRF